MILSKVGEIMIDYKKSLYSNKLDRASQEYANTKSEVIKSTMY